MQMIDLQQQKNLKILTIVNIKTDPRETRIIRREKDE